MSTPSDDSSIRVTLKDLGLTEAYPLGQDPENPIVPLFCRLTKGPCIHSLNDFEGGLLKMEGTLNTLQEFTDCSFCLRTQER